MLETLPSPEEVQALASSTAEIARVLNQVSISLGNMPTNSEAAKTKEVLLQLGSILDRNPMLRGILTTKTSTRSRRETRKSTPNTYSLKDVALKEIEHFNLLPEDALRTVLVQEKYNSALLRAILLELGRNMPSKATKKDMVDQIVLTLVNRRTYEGLRGGASN